MEYETIIKNQLDALELENLEKMLKETPEEYRLFDEITVNGIINDLINGETIFETDKILINLKELFFYEIKTSIMLGCEIIVICIFIGMLTNLSTSFGSKAVSSIGTLICGFVMILLCMGSFYKTYDTCSQTINIMTSTMELLLPIMIPLLISMGGLSSGSIMNPVIITSVTGFNFIMQNIVLPLIYFSAVFILINSITEKDYVKKLAEFLRKAAIFITGLTITIFSGITAIQGIVTKSADSLLMKTARYSVDNFIPIIGGFAADSLDMVLSCIGVIKNSIGIIGIVILLSLLVMPIVKLMSIAVIYKLTAVVAEPVANKNISDSLNELGSSAITLTVVLSAGAFMFLIFITVIMGMGGGTA